MGQMLLKGLAKVKSQSTPNTQIMLPKFYCNIGAHQEQLEEVIG